MNFAKIVIFEALRPFLQLTSHFCLETCTANGNKVRMAYLVDFSEATFFPIDHNDVESDEVDLRK